MVRDLNRSARGPARREPGPQDGGLEPLLAWAAGRKASDLFLVAGSEVAARIDGEVVVLEGPRLTADSVGAMLRDLLEEADLERLRRDRSLDRGFERPGTGRFRANVHFQGGAPAVAIRILPAAIPPIESLGLPPAVAGLADLRSGLVLITGTAGCGKSTTLAALLSRIAETRSGHVITIEDPVEYRLPHGRGIVEQIELGRDTPSFAAALRASLRQAPDVLMVGEMRDRETAATALTAAETGHLVFSTLHTGSAMRSVERIVDLFPAERHELTRSQVAGSLQAVVSQVLLPRAGGAGGRVPACEVLLATDAIRKRVRQGETHHLHQEITLGKKLGMRTLEESLADLVRSGQVDRDAAAPWARHRDEFDNLVGGG